MTMKQIKGYGDCTARSVYCRTVREYYGNAMWRIITTGRKYVRLMSPSGRIISSIDPSDIEDVWTS